MRTHVLRPILGTLGFLACVSFAVPAQAQSLQERMANVRAKQSRAASADKAQARQIQLRMAAIIKNVELREVTGKEALSWFSATSGVPTVINWKTLQAAGVDPEATVSLSLPELPASKALELILSQMSPEGTDLMTEVTPWYINITTKAELNKKTTTQIYLIGDLLHKVPDFKNAPKFDLNEITRASSGGSGSSGSLFGDDEAEEEEQKTAAEQADEIVQLIRDNVEPTIWRENGGTATITKWKETLIITAPKYVHEKIGTPISSIRSNNGAGGAGAGAGNVRTGAGAVGFDPTVGVANSGHVFDVQGWVSADRRYVNLTTGFTQATVRQPIRTVQVQGAVGGQRNGFR